MTRISLPREVLDGKLDVARIESGYVGFRGGEEGLYWGSWEYELSDRGSRRCVAFERWDADAE